MSTTFQPLAGHPLLEVTDLRVRYRDGNGDEHTAVDGVELTVRPGELVALVGESGSGKTSLIHAALGVLPANGSLSEGRARFGGVDTSGWSDRRFSTVRGPFVGFVPQDPGTALNPVKRIGAQVAEAILLHARLPRAQARQRALDTLRVAGLTDVERVAEQYPHQLSGGMKQRTLIAIALASDPALLIADEPTSALDVTVQKTILDHLDRLRVELNLGVLLVTHDLGVATERADRLVIMRHGRIVEAGPTAQVERAPADPYTRHLLASAPSASSARLLPRTTPDPSYGEPMLVVDGLTKRFTVGSGRRSGQLVAVDDVSFSVPRGSTHAIVGESGAGKSTVARIVAGFEKPDAGRVRIDGLPEFPAGRAARKSFRRHVQLVYQNPFSSLDPRYPVRRLVEEPLRIHGLHPDPAAREARVQELVEAVALDGSFLGRRPGELSGGQRQRVAIARALALDPPLLVLDETVSALDVSVQAQILRLLVDLQAERGLTYLFVTHDLGVVRLIADSISVMRAGRVVEQGPAAELFADPHQDYTRALLAAVPGNLVP